VSPAESFWRRRLGWRLRAAWQWPAFALMTLLDALVIYLLPPVAGVLDPDRLDPVLSLLLALFGNLFIVAVLAPLLARGLASRQARMASAYEGMPEPVSREIARDRIATALLVAGLFGVLVAGLASRPIVVSETEATERNADLVREYVGHSGDEELQRNLETANTIEFDEDGLFRTCIARDDRRHRTCFFVDTKKDPAELRVDPSGQPNSAFDRRSQ
jgi:hypothetical protein